MSLAVGIEVTRACNFRCRHCFVDAGRRGKAELTRAEIARLLEDVQAAGAQDICWSGGEPLLRKDLEALTALAAEQGLAVGMVSNGYFATRERLATLADAGLGGIQVSLDGPDRASAERWRLGPKNAFEKAQAAVRTAVELGLQTTVCALLTPETAGELDAMRALVRELGAPTLRYTLWGPVGRAAGKGFDERAWATPAVARFLEQVDGLAEDDLPAVVLDCATGPLPRSGRFDCTAGLRAVYVCANGDVYPCTSLMEPAYRVGNLREVPLLALLRDPDMLKVHREILRAPLAGACASCAWGERCHGGCPGNALAAFGEVVREKGVAAALCLKRLHEPDAARATGS